MTEQNRSEIEYYKKYLECKIETETLKRVMIGCGVLIAGAASMLFASDFYYRNPDYKALASGGAIITVLASVGWATHYKNKRLKELDTAISFEEFVTKRKDVGWPEYNNFPIRFFDEEYAPWYDSIEDTCSRKEKPYKIFKKEAPELNATLEKAVTNADRQRAGFFDRMKTHESDLYKAYLHMRSAGASDEELLN